MAAVTTFEHAVSSIRNAGGVTLPGRRSDTLQRWLQQRRRVAIAAGIIVGVGLVSVILGLALREVGLWSLAIPVGVFFAFIGLAILAVTLLTNHLMGGRLRAATRPVVIDASGVTLRGIGPIPWHDLAPPERRHIPVKNDIGGRCTVMPLTAQGHARVNSQLGWWTHLVGPKPYLRFDVPYLLLPGIDGLSEDETMELFRIAHEQYLR